MFSQIFATICWLVSTIYQRFFVIFPVRHENHLRWHFFHKMHMDQIRKAKVEQTDKAQRANKSDV